MKLPLSFSCFVALHVFRGVSCDVEETLETAIARDDVGIVKKFLRGENREGVLREAIMEGGNDRAVVPRDSRPRIGGNGALHWAVIKKAPKVTRLLLANGADVNSLNFAGLTPLFLAALNYSREDLQRDKRGACDEEVMDTLLEFNPDVRIKDDLGITPLFFAVESDNVPLAAKLLARGGDGGHINDRCTALGKTALHTAVEHGRVRMTEFLLENGAETDAVDAHGENVLHAIFNTKGLYWPWLRARGQKHQSAIAKLLLKSENAGEMLKQRESRDFRTPADVFFKQSMPKNREIMVDLLKILPDLDDAYAVSALRTFSSSLKKDSSNWPLDNFPEYVKRAFNSYDKILSEKKCKKKSFRLNGAWAEFFFCGITAGTKFATAASVSPKCHVQHFIENGFYSLYVILRTTFRVHHRDGRDGGEGAEETEKFDEYLRQLSAPFQNALCDALSEGTKFEILPPDISRNIYQRSLPYIQRFAKIMSLVEFTRSRSVEEMVDEIPAFVRYLEQQRDIPLL